LRTRIAPVAIPTLAKFEAVRDFLFRTVSQIMINYRHCSFNAGEAGDIHGGDRLPWVVAEGTDNYEPLAHIVWQVHVYGGAVHAFTNPDAGSAGVAALAYHPTADKRSWNAMHGLFEEVFGATG